jgi:hypothetical protein
MMAKMDKKANWTKIKKTYWTKKLIIFFKMGQLCEKKKNWLILGKISQKNNFFKNQLPDQVQIGTSQ